MSRVSLSLRVEGGRVALRAPRGDDATRLTEVRRRSWEFLSPWMPVPPPEVEDLAASRRQIARQRRAWLADQAYPWFVVGRDDDELIGRVAFTEVVRGVSQCASVGYWMDVLHAGRGLMTEALGLGLELAFGPMGLHRVQAAILPHNGASLAVARKLGLREEGRALRYLYLGGRWEDHLLFAITAEEWPARRARDVNRHG